MNKEDLHHIIALCGKNDRLAQEKLYRSFFGLFFTIAKDYVSDNEQIIGIVNEAFLKIFLNIGQFDVKKGPFEVWSKRIVQNVCIDTYRKEKNKPFIAELSDENARAYFDEQHHSAIFNEDMEKIFNQLPPVTGKVCRLFLIEGYSHREISQFLHINESTCRWHLLEGKKKLRELLKDRNG